MVDLFIAMALREDPLPNSEKLIVLRYLQKDFLGLIYKLNELSIYVASLEITNDLKAVAHLQRYLVLHVEQTKEFKKRIDGVRIEIENERLSQQIRAKNKRKKKVIKFH